MRIWTLHPKYLDPPGLTALWREALLARKVLLNRTRGYRHHPQLQRFRKCARPVAAINAYLMGVHLEATSRSYHFDQTKIGRTQLAVSVPEALGQLEYEWRHLQAKLRARNPRWLRSLSGVRQPEPHPLFHIVSGPVQPWERGVRGAET